MPLTFLPRSFRATAGGACAALTGVIEGTARRPHLTRAGLTVSRLEKVPATFPPQRLLVAVHAE